MEKIAAAEVLKQFRSDLPKLGLCSRTAFLFAIGKILIGLYLGKANVASGFGAAGSLVILLLWVYFGAQIFLLGAELTWVYSNTYGSKSALGTARSFKNILQGENNDKE